MNNTLVKIIQSREDISDYLFHFTKGSNALKILETIISDRKIKDMKIMDIFVLQRLQLLC